MKNLIFAAALAVIVLPQVSFAAPATTNTNSFSNSNAFSSGNSSSSGNASSFYNLSSVPCDQLDARSSAFFNWQAGQRGAFIQGNPQSIAAHDAHFKAMLAIDMAKRVGKSTSGMPTPPDDDAVFVAFQAKQLDEKNSFLANLNQARQNCASQTTNNVASLANTPTTETTTTTPPADTTTTATTAGTT